MSSIRRGNLYPNWTTYGSTYAKKQQAKMAAARSAARSMVISNTRQMVRRLPINIPPSNELKAVDYAYNVYTIAVGTSYNVSIQGPINAIATGTGRYQRIGSKITPSSVDFELFLTNMSPTINARCRYALIWDKQANGSAPGNVNLIYQDLFADGTTNTSMWSGRNRDTTDRFQTIATGVYMLGAQSNSINTSPIAMVTRTTPLRGLQQQFKGVAADIGSISSGALYCVMMSTIDVTNGVQCFGSFRYKYYDA